MCKSVFLFRNKTMCTPAEKSSVCLLNQSENGKFNLISVDLRRMRGYFIFWCVHIVRVFWKASFCGAFVLVMTYRLTVNLWIFSPWSVLPPLCLLIHLLVETLCLLTVQSGRRFPTGKTTNVVRSSIVIMGGPSQTPFAHYSTMILRGLKGDS